MSGRDTEWLESLKAGDEVAVFASFARVPRIDKVDRVTPTLIVVGHNRFRRSSGYRVGASAYDTSSIQQPTQEFRDAAEAKHLREQLEVAMRRPLSLETLRAIAAAIATGAAK